MLAAYAHPTKCLLDSAKTEGQLQDTARPRVPANHFRDLRFAECVRTAIIRPPDRTTLCSLPRWWELAAAYPVGPFLSNLPDILPASLCSTPSEGGIQYLPLGILGQAGLTWAASRTTHRGQPVVTQNGAAGILRRYG